MMAEQSHLSNQTGDMSSSVQIDMDSIPKNDQTFDFVSTTNDDSVSGSLSPKSGEEFGFDGVRSRGGTSQFLDTKGFGWLMEVEDDDEDFQKPLL